MTFLIGNWWIRTKPNRGDQPQVRLVNNSQLKVCINNLLVWYVIWSLWWKISRYSLTSTFNLSKIILWIHKSSKDLVNIINNQWTKIMNQILQFNRTTHPNINIMKLRKALNKCNFQNKSHITNMKSKNLTIQNKRKRQQVLSLKKTSQRVILTNQKHLWLLTLCFSNKTEKYFVNVTLKCHWLKLVVWEERFGEI